MNANGSGQTNLTNNMAADYAPSWSPDGSKIAFGRTNNSDQEVYVMNANGSGQTNLTNNTAADYAPAWSPDGSKVAFTSNRDGNIEIYVMNANGSGQTNVSNTTPGQDCCPDWQPLTSVGGITEPPGVDGAPLTSSGDRSGANAGLIAALAGIAGAVGLGGTAWYARRRES